MGYKVGDEVLVRMRIVDETEYTYGVNTKEGILVPVEKEDVIPIPDMTAGEACEIARRIVDNIKSGGFSKSELEDIFRISRPSKILSSYSPRTARDRIEEWKTKNGIKVGDEVVPKVAPNVNEYKFVVTKICEEDGRIEGVSVFDGGVFSGRDIEIYQKTGRHVDIEGLLKQIGGDE